MKQCPQCKNEFELIEFTMVNKNNQTASKKLCRRCRHINSENSKIKAEVKRKNKSDEERQKRIDEGIVKKCSKCNRYRVKETFTKSTHICDGCMIFMEKQAISMNHEKERKEMRKKFYHDKQNMSLEEKLNKCNANNSMIDDFLNNKKVQK